MAFHVPEQYRLKCGPDEVQHKAGDPYGRFLIPAGLNRPFKLQIVATNGEPDDKVWEHVSVSTPVRCPTWDEMCLVKSLFWDPEDTVIQLHPPQSQWVNRHNYCLHLWRPMFVEIPLPPQIYV